MPGEAAPGVAGSSTRHPTQAAPCYRRGVPERRIYVTDAIVLSRFDFGEADRILTLITPEYGKLKAIAKGVRRQKSRIGGSLEPFAELRVQLARGRTFDVVTQVTVGHAWLRLRDNLESAATAWYLAELADRSLEERHAAEPLYALLHRAYELLDAGMAPRPRRPLVRDAPRRRAGRPARARALRRVRPAPRADRHVPLGAAARRRALPARPGAAGRPGRPEPATRSRCCGPTSASTPRRISDLRLLPEVEREVEAAMRAFIADRPRAGGAITRRSSTRSGSPRPAIGASRRDGCRPRRWTLEARSILRLAGRLSTALDGSCRVGSTTRTPTATTAYAVGGQTECDEPARARIRLGVADRVEDDVGEQGDRRCPDRRPAPPGPTLEPESWAGTGAGSCR